MTDFTHKRAFMDGVKTGREQNSAERKILLERINKLEEQLSAEKLAAGYWMEQSCRDHNRAEKAEQQLADEKKVAGFWMDQSCKDHNRAEKAEQRITQYQSKYNNLLAVAHRDGGRYLAEYGEEKAGEDAITAILTAYHNNDRYQGGIEVEVKHEKKTA